ncbi:MAG: GSCFA domain-containing protein [Bacteroidales bacterium]|nr:GSCFA domain-containing protein [Bacteroidales bacterium]
MDSKTFRTVMKAKSFDFDISYHSKMMFIGSCFTENIGNKLKNLKFKVNINPFGIIYNPISVVQSLDFIVENKQFKDSDLFFYNEYWHSFYHHGKFSQTVKEKTLDLINISISDSLKFLKDTDFLFITLGTAWIYSHVKTNKIVANCHKVPASEFEKRILNEHEIVSVFNEFIDKIRLINTKLKIIFSVSPVRHLKDGFSENFLSKAILRTAIEKIIKNNSDTYYFPAYEILNDDLRDYRFYNSDLVHPNEQATTYIFDFFKTFFFSDETEMLADKVQKIISARNHKLFNSGTEQSKKFIISSLKDIENLKKKYSFLNLDNEETYFLSQK